MNNEIYRLYKDMPVFDTSRVWAEIDLEALRHNYRYIRDRIHSTKSDCRFIAVVKANAYGHGIELISRILAEEGCDFFAVATLDEAIAVRCALESVPHHCDILMLGSTDAAYAPIMARYDLIVSLPSFEYSKKLSQIAEDNGVVVRAHVKLDTGMNRIGFPTFSDEACRLAAEQIAEINKCKNISIDGIYSHFACAEDVDEHARARTELQAQRFFTTVDYIKEHGVSLDTVHICNSSAAFVADRYLADGARIGVILFGFNPSPVVKPPFKPTMKLCARVIRVVDVAPGEEISYSGLYVVDKPTRVATVSIGYADGLYRRSAGARVHFRKRSGEYIGEGTIIGRVCMDMCMVDVGELDVELDDTFVLFETIDEVYQYADHVRTIPHECLCHISPRVPRIVVNDKK